MADTIRIQILPGGLVKLETDRISSPNHLSADRLVRGLEEDLGGGTETRRKAEGTLAHAHQTTHHDLA
jgi:hypothetical protein